MYIRVYIYSVSPFFIKHYYIVGLVYHYYQMIITSNKFYLLTIHILLLFVVIKPLYSHYCLKLIAES